MSANRNRPVKYLTLNSLRDSTLLFPAISGLLLLLLMLIIAVAIKDPTPLQYLFFRIVIALAGAAFAATLTGTLEVYIPLLHKGYIKAGLGLGVFVILFFLSPANLVIDDSKISAIRYINDYKTSIQANIASLDDIWKAADAQEVFQDIANPTSDKLNRLSSLIKGKLQEKSPASQFNESLFFFQKIANCANSGGCDKNLVCDALFDQIEAFRNFYCGIISDEDRMQSSKIQETLEDFSIDTCRFNFVSRYLSFKDRSFKDACLPVQCWAEHVDPPYPCQVRRQVTTGILVPSSG